jgi:dTDP-4-dehydrorhamnose 3,5-epimerase
MKFIPASIKDVIIVEPEVFGDQRGFFMETFRRDLFREHGIGEFLQWNHSRSVKGTLRGLHYQAEKSQGKLVRVIQGEIFDVAVDIRFGSPTFGKWVAEVLSSDNKKQIFVPIGFAHGFCVTSETAEVIYACTDYYHPAAEKGIIWNDPDLNIPWPVQSPLLSDKDRNYPRFKEIGRDFVY